MKGGTAGHNEGLDSPQSGYSCNNSRESATKVLVIMPTYNEIESAPALISRVTTLAPEVHVLVVDDGSPDGTADAIELMNSADLLGRVHVIRRTEKSGLGAAYLAGFSWGIENGYETLIEMDADGSHRPEDLVTLDFNSTSKAFRLAL